MRKLIAFSVDHPKLVTILMLLVTVVVGVQMVRIEVDTDPENMLSEEEFVRAFHREVKKERTIRKRASMQGGGTQPSSTSLAYPNRAGAPPVWRKTTVSPDASRPERARSIRPSMARPV